jgi:hypothetical protein
VPAVAAVAGSVPPAAAAGGGTAPGMIGGSTRGSSVPSGAGVSSPPASTGSRTSEAKKPPNGCAHGGSAERAGCDWAEGCDGAEGCGGSGGVGARASGRAAAFSSPWPCSGADIALPKACIAAIAPRCISTAWIVVRSIDRLATSHCSTAFRSVMRRSISPRSIVGANADGRLSWLQVLRTKSTLSSIRSKPIPMPAMPVSSWVCGESSRVASRRAARSGGAQPESCLAQRGDRASRGALRQARPPAPPAGRSGRTPSAPARRASRCGSGRRSA